MKDYMKDWYARNKEKLRLARLEKKRSEKSGGAKASAQAGGKEHKKATPAPKGVKKTKVKIGCNWSVLSGRRL